MKDKFCFSKIFISISIAICMLFALYANVFVAHINNSLITNASTIENELNDEQTEQDYSIFIYEPIYSTFYNDKIYFIDKYDNLLKIHDPQTNSFDKNPISLSTYSEIISATSINNYMFLIAVKEDERVIVCIDLEDLSIIELNHSDLNIDENYIRIASASLSDGDYAVTLTPKEITENTFPYIIKINIDESDGSFNLNIFKIDMFQNNQSREELYGPLFKVLVSSNDGRDYLLFVYNKNFVYCNLTFDNSTISVNSIIDIQNQIDINLDKPIENVNILLIQDVKYLIITNRYEPEIGEINETRITSKLYSFSIGNTSTDYFKYENEEFKTNSNILANNEYLIYSNKQVITHVKIIKNEDNTYFRDTINSSNPEINKEYFSDSDFIYYITNGETLLLTSPWNYGEPICTVKENSNVICVAEISIEGSNLPVSDYKYCIYTLENKNYIGYLKTANLVEKEEVSLSEYGKVSENKPYPRVKTYQNTNLYSLPTVTTGIIDSLPSGEVKINSYVVEQIIYNSKVEVIDAIYGYSFKNASNNDEIMLKVRVNDNKIGYITKSSLISPSDINNFVITNSSIKGNTYVYLQESLSSPVIALLSDGFRVRINGTRNAKTGFINITFNDEYGNEFSGYVKIDSASSDNWSTLQIIGCVLIAINIGLLILILIFKHRDIGQNGQKYIKNKKENYKKNNQI